MLIKKLLFLQCINIINAIPYHKNFQSLQESSSPPSDCHNVVYHYVAKSLPMSEGHGIKKAKIILSPERVRYSTYAATQIPRFLFIDNVEKCISLFGFMYIVQWGWLCQSLSDY
jgi:hypothetical protein